MVSAARASSAAFLRPVDAASAVRSGAFTCSTLSGQLSPNGFENDLPTCPAKRGTIAAKVHAMTSFPQALQTLGLKTIQIQDWFEVDPEAHPWRVRAVDRGLCRLVSLPAIEGNTPTDQTRPTGAQHQRLDTWPASFITRDVTPGADPVAVGDWVLVTEDPHPRVGHILERATLLRRGATLDRSADQLIAANLDVVFVVCAFAETAKLNQRGLNPRRIERYVSAVCDGGATAVCVLNKADLSSDTEQVRRGLASRLGNVEVLTVSAHSGDGTQTLLPYLAEGQSVAFVGMSGVGKSSLINCLLRAPSQDTGATRGSDSKGKHTTTRREMLRMPGGALLIDTPGLRELALASDGEAAGFEDIETLAEACRFSDCSHDTEPGCAVVQAIQDGRLEAERFESYVKLSREALRHRARHDAYARHLQNQEFRRFAKVVKEAGKAKRR